MNEPHATADDPSLDFFVSYRDRSIRFAAFGGHIEHKLRGNHFYEEQMLQYIEALGLEGAYLDIGAFIGTHAMFLAAYCRARRVHAFEPRAKCFELLARHMTMNGLDDRVALHRLGLSDHDEQVEIDIEGKTERITCRRLDDVVAEPVSLMKIDVEGMEAKVLGGASRLLAQHKPLIFLEAHTRDELDRDAALLAPYGYRPTGRVFNASPTYEFAAADVAHVPAARMPTVRSLAHTAWFTPEDPAIEVRADGDRLTLTSRMPPSRVAHATQAPVNLRRAPAERLIAIEPGATYFLQATGTMTEGLGVAFFVMEYDAHARTSVHKHYFHPRMFQRLDLRPDTRAIRIAIRLGGPGELVLERIALHVVLGGGGDPEVPEVAPTPASLADGDLVVPHGGATVRFAPFGGRVAEALRAGRFEHEEMLDYVESLGLDGAVVEVGAHVGARTVFLARFASARVHAFEARPACVAHLRRNLDANGLADRVVVHAVELGAADEGETRRLDAVVDEPCAIVVVTARDPAPVLAGAERLLRRDRPLVLVAAPAGGLDAVVSALAPAGYRATGRVFGEPPFHELAVPGSVAANLLPEVRSLLVPELWLPEEPGLEVAVVAGALRVASRLDPYAAAHVTQDPPKLRRAPSEDRLAVPPGATVFVEADGVFDGPGAATIFLMEYDGHARTQVHKLRLERRMFPRVELAPTTQTVRVAVRIHGPGTAELTALALHVAHPRS